MNPALYSSPSVARENKRKDDWNEGRCIRASRGDKLETLHFTSDEHGCVVVAGWRVSTSRVSHHAR